MPEHRSRGLDIGLEFGTMGGGFLVLPPFLVLVGLVELAVAKASAAVSCRSAKAMPRTSEPIAETAVDNAARRRSS